MFGRSLIAILCIVAGYAEAFQNVTDFFMGLNHEEDLILASAFRNKNYDNSDQVLDIIKAKSEKLHKKVFRFRNLVIENVEKLEDDNAKKFVKETFTLIASTLPAYTRKNYAAVAPAINEFLKKYKSLGAKSKTSLKKVFPDVIGFIDKQIARDEEAARINPFVFRPCRGLCYDGVV